MARVLVIDDDRVFTTLVAEALAAAGHRVDVAADGRQGLVAVRTTRFDAVVTDIIMPDQEGIETIRLIRRSDPGNPDVCPVGDLHKIFSSKETMAKVNEGCRSAGIGCIECKGWAADALVKILNPMQERRKKYEDNPRLAWDILEAGSAAAAKVADATMRDVRASMGMSLEYEPPKPDIGK